MVPLRVDEIDRSSTRPASGCARLLENPRLLLVVDARVQHVAEIDGPVVANLRLQVGQPLAAVTMQRLQDLHDSARARRRFAMLLASYRRRRKLHVGAEAIKRAAGRIYAG